jgi:hypothetical protein
MDEKPAQFDADFEMDHGFSSVYMMDHGFSSVYVSFGMDTGFSCDGPWIFICVYPWDGPGFSSVHNFGMVPGFPRYNSVGWTLDFPLYISFLHAAGVQPDLLLRVAAADGGLLQRVRKEAKLNLEVMTNIGKNY